MRNGWLRGAGLLCGVCALLLLTTGCPTTPVPPPCEDNAGCDNGEFCDGAETCVEGACQDGTAPCAEDEMCNEDLDRCDECETNEECDDGAFCNGAETCTDGQCANGVAPCAVGEFCNEPEDSCDECAADGDCDDGAFCNGTETCVDGACAAGTDPCAEGEVCDEANDECRAPDCDEDADCDDGVFCNGAETCDGGLCMDGAEPCAEGDVCDEENGECVEIQCDEDGDCPEDGNNCTEELCQDGLCVTEDVVCEEGETCDPATGNCVTDTCDSDEDCDDGEFCNGLETCNLETGECEPGDDPCADTDCGGDTPICQESDNAAECSCPPVPTLDFTLGQDALTGTTGNDIFRAPLEFSPGAGTQVQTLQVGDTANGLAGNDTLNATLNGTTIVPTLAGIEDQNYTVFVATTLTATNISGVDTITTKNSTATFTIGSLQEATDLGVSGVVDGASGLAATFATAVTTGNDDSVGVNVDGSNAGTVTITTGAVNGFETLSVNSTGSPANKLVAIAQGVGTTMKTANFTGDQDLAIQTLPATIKTYDGSAMTGGLTLGNGTCLGANCTSVYATFATVDLTDLMTGDGDDVLIFAGTLDGNDASGTTSFLDFGGGTNIVQASFGATVGTQLPLRNVQEVRFNATANGVSINLGGVTGVTDVTIENDGTSNTFTLLNVPGTPDLNFRGDGTQNAQVYDTVTYTSNSATGSSDVLNLNVGNGGTALNATGTTNVHTIGGAALTAANIETINVDVTDGPATFAGLTMAAATTFNFTASSNLTLGTVAGGTTTSVSAANVVGNFSATFTTLGAGAQVTLGNGTTNTLSIAGSPGATISVTGGTGADTITGSAQADVIAGGSGNDVIVGGAGIDTLTGGSGSDVFDFSTIVLAANASNISDFSAGANNDILRFDATTFTDYSAGATVTFGAGGPGAAELTAGVDNVIIRATAAVILTTTPAAGAQAVIAVATDTGDIYYDANGNFTAGAVVIGNIPAAQVASLVAGNFVIVP
jgi:Ca2+-binding RTX toxin-like protein